MLDLGFVVVFGGFEFWVWSALLGCLFGWVLLGVLGFDLVYLLVWFVGLFSLVDGLLLNASLIRVFTALSLFAGKFVVLDLGILLWICFSGCCFRLLVCWFVGFRVVCMLWCYGVTFVDFVLLVWIDGVLIIACSCHNCLDCLFVCLILWFALCCLTLYLILVIRFAIEMTWWRFDLIWFLGVCFGVICVCIWVWCFFCLILIVLCVLGVSCFAFVVCWFALIVLLFVC